MKKFVTFFLIVMILTFSFGCGTYNGINNNGTGSGSGSGSGNGSGSRDENAFSVSLIFDGQPFEDVSGMQAQWKNDTEIHRANFDKNGVAYASGLDGNYAVTLIGLDDKYMYDTNYQVATNFDKDITIEIHEYNTMKGSGTDSYHTIALHRKGAYKVTLNSEDHVVFFGFSPDRSGAYLIETIADVSKNEVNPSIDVYSGSAMWNQYSHTIDTGGSSAEYTRNALYPIRVSKEKVGNTYVFALKATHREGLYPIKLSFLIRYESDWQDPIIDPTVKIPNQTDLITRGHIPQPTGTLTYPEVKIGEGTYQFKEKMFDLNADDGFYHVYNEATGKYDGPIVYAQISAPHRFFAPHNGQPISFTNVESVGNSALTLENGTENYSLFIMGGSAIKDYVGLENYTSYVGYGNFSSNKDGVYPVTDDLQEFLQKFAISQRYFNDGNGWAETVAESQPGADGLGLGYRIYSSENAQWLFACCYYV